MDPTSTPEETLPPLEPRNIAEYLERMVSDAEAIEQRILQGPVDLAGPSVGALYTAILKIKKRLEAAKKVWKDGK